MTTDSDRLLQDRFARSVPPAEPLDWADVVIRCRRHAERPRTATRRRLLLLAAALVALLAVAGSAIAISGSTTGIKAIDDLLDRTQHGSGPVDPHAPPRGVRPVPGSLSEPLEFEHDGRTLTTIGFRSEQHGICAALVESAAKPERPVGAVGCISPRILRDSLAKSPVHVFAGGGGDIQDVQGFARSDVVKLTRVDDGGPGTVALSEPWSPDPWDGDPIRFFYSVTTEKVPDDPARGVPWHGLRLRAELADGRTVEVGP
jgi:hypothetical protein